MPANVYKIVCFCGVNTKAKRTTKPGRNLPKGWRSRNCDCGRIGCFLYLCPACASNGLNNSWLPAPGDWVKKLSSRRLAKGLAPLPYDKPWTNEVRSRKIDG